MSFFQKAGCLTVVFLGGFGLTKLLQFLYFAFMIPNSAMEPMIQPGDHLLVRKMSHASPHRGELLVFKTKEGFALKRVVAVAGDRVKIRQKKLFVNGLLQEEEYVVHNDRGMLPVRDEFPADSHELVVPKGTSFALGDNRDKSLDSRAQGCYPDTSIAGYPSMILYSVELSGGSATDPPRQGAYRSNRFLKSF